MNFDTHGRSANELLQEWRDLAAELRRNDFGDDTQNAADCIDALCNACQDYDGRLTDLRGQVYECNERLKNLRELMHDERESADAQLSDAIAHGKEQRAAAFQLALGCMAYLNVDQIKEVCEKYGVDAQICPARDVG